MGVIGDVFGLLNDGVDYIAFSVPGTISHVLGGIRDNYSLTPIDRNVYGAVKGVIDGLIQLHHLSATASNNPTEDEKDRFRDHYDREPVLETAARRLAMLGGVAIYHYLGSRGHPEVIFVPVVTNVMDVGNTSRDLDDDCYAALESEPDWIHDRYSLIR